MTQDARIVGFEEKAVLKFLDFLHHAVAAHVETGHVTVEISTDGLDQPQTQLAVDEAYDVKPGYRVKFDNQSGKELEIGFDDPSVFDLEKIVVPIGRQPVLRVSLLSDIGMMKFSLGGTGGGTRHIKVNPPEE